MPEESPRITSDGDDHEPHAVAERLAELRG
jgi:hypothetical protein